MFVSQVYKKKTEAAKKEYLKALAAYRASLVSKGAGEGEAIYGNYSNYPQGAPQYGSYQPQGMLILTLQYIVKIAHRKVLRGGLGITSQI